MDGVMAGRIEEGGFTRRRGDAETVLRAETQRAQRVDEVVGRFSGQRMHCGALVVKALRAARSASVSSASLRADTLLLRASASAREPISFDSTRS